MKIKKLLFPFCILFAACTNSAQPTTDKESDKANTASINDSVKNVNESSNFSEGNIVGTWMTSCEGGAGHISISSLSKEATIEVNPNQIVIGASIDTSDLHDRVIRFRLTSPGDLGAGGANLNWNHFSKDSVIAKLEIVDSVHANLTWYGFYDKKLNKYIWKHDFSMLLDESGKATQDRVSVINCDRKYQ